MQLIFDTGNTVQKCAVFGGDEVIKTFSAPEITIADVESLTKEFSIDHFILSTVRDHNKSFEHYLKEHFRGIILSPETPLPIQNAYATPETLGNDRLAGAVGANALFPQQAVLVVDAGTCIKYDFVNASNTYLGGGISPGLNMRLVAMHNYTARLPLIPLDILEEEELVLTGNSTTRSMLSGALMGALLEVEGMVAAYSEKYGQLQVIITGGDAVFFEKRLKCKIFAHPNLVLFGLHKILDHHLKQA